MRFTLQLLHGDLVWSDELGWNETEATIYTEQELLDEKPPVKRGGCPCMWVGVPGG